MVATPAEPTAKLKLTPADCELLGECTCGDARFAPPQSGRSDRLTLALTWDEREEIQGCGAHGCNPTADRAHERRLAGLLAKLEAGLARWARD